MSPEVLHAEVQSYRTSGRLAEDFSQIRDKVANDPNLTITGKREHLEPMHRDVTDQIAALRAREKSRSQKPEGETRTPSVRTLTISQQQPGPSRIVPRRTNPPRQLNTPTTPKNSTNQPNAQATPSRRSSP